MGALAKVISGGQTGVDRAALRAARACGLGLGGWCPPGRESESGPVPADLPLIETPRERSPSAPDVPRSLRTEWNVRDSDATLVLRPASGAADDPGTEWALRSAALLRRPVLVCDPAAPDAAERIRGWIDALRVRTLNVAGPAESACPGIGALAERVLARAFRPA
ncbi:MAG TPA: putative molybdenum carrier protein [Anaeromyxobacter sp.]|nr:putative molybdenum carrier protein [Anaeromyxobacter sp.]